MKKLVALVVISSCVLASSAMAAGIASYCPTSNNVQVKTIDGKTVFVGSTPGLPDAFVSTMPATLGATVGEFQAATDYLPAYGNPSGQIACNYTNATLWLVNPTKNAMYNNAKKEWQGGYNAFMCWNSDARACQFTVGDYLK